MSYSTFPRSLALMIVAVSAVCIASMPAGAQVSITSPGGDVSATVKVVGGRLTYNLNRGATPVLEDSDLGINVGGVDLGDGVTLGTPAVSTINETYDYLGDASTLTDHARLYEIPVTHTGSGRNYTLEVRAYDGGLAYRYVVPGFGEQEVFGEASSWKLPSSATAWYQTNTAQYEGTYQSDPVTSIAGGTDIGGPMTFKLADGSYAAITEAALHNYTGMTFEAAGSGRFNAEFIDKQLRHDLESPGKPGVDQSWLPDDRWRVDGDVVSPWRVTMTAPDLDGLVNSHVVQHVNPRPDIGIDWSFVKPGRSVWSWWEHGHLDGSTARLNLEKRYIDRAAELGFEYILLDDNWTQFDSAEEQELLDYAASKDIGVWVWYMYSHADNGTINNECWPWGSSSTRDNFYSKLVNKGIVGVKLDFMDSESTDSLNWYTGNLADAAEYGIMVNFHGANKPTGESVTFPNEMTREGVRGLEHYRNNGSNPNNQHAAILPFTRQLGGSMDYTPVTFNPQKMGDNSYAHQLATAVVFVSPVTHWADDPDLYVASAAADVISAMPAVWDETVVFDNSEIGDLAAFARRTGEDWFIGVLNGAESARTENLDLSFLSGGFRARLLGDDASSNTAWDDSTIVLDPRDDLSIWMRDSGGFVGHLEALMPGDADGDDAVDVGDLGILAGAWGTASGARWYSADFSGDGAVDVADLGILAGNWGAGSVPEPTSMALLVGGLVWSIVRRRN